MCAILDANVAGQVFAAERPAAGQEFFRWINSGRGRLVVGGRLLDELDRNRNFKEWRVQAGLAGRVIRVSDNALEEKMRELRERNVCRSDDEHVVAVALVGGARLLYTNDRDLQRDFKNRELVDGPRGKVYSSQVGGGEVRPQHRRLLADTSLCTRQGR